MSDNGKNPNGAGNTGPFKLQIDERELAGESYRRPAAQRPAAEPPRRTRQSTAAAGSGGYYTANPNDKAERKAHKKRNRVKARKNKWIFRIVWLCMVLLVSFTLASYLIGGARDFFAVTRSEGTTQVELPDEVDAKSLSELLYQRGAIGKPEFFRLYASITVDEDEWADFQKGVYQLGTNLDYQDIISRLTGGNQTREEVRITFPEGSNALEIARLLEENDVCTAEEFLTALNEDDFSNYKLIAQMGDGAGKYYKLEGYLFPDTYDFWKGEEVDSVIGKMLNNFQTQMSEATLAAVEQSGYSLDQIVVMASIIQGEAANAADMYLVSAVLHNRLSFGAEYGIYTLQCDSTMYYPYKNLAALEDSDRSLSYGNYDTYQVSGLPAGAICNPGMDAIQAALNPSTEGDAPAYLYFCHADDGTAYYATNEYDHAYNLWLAGLAESY